jgi:RNA polymerase-associated protein RTF1
MDSDDEMDLETPVVNVDPAIKALSERDMLWELNLPESLRNLKKGELQELVAFRRSHTEIQWEAELARRQDSVSKALDFERLRKMKGETAKAPAKKAGKKKKELDSDEEDDIFGESDEDEPLPDPNASAALLESDEDSILFDSDEEREVTKKKPKAKKAAAKKAPATKKTKKRARDEDEDDYDDLLEEDGEEEADDKDNDAPLVEDVDESEPAELTDYLKIQSRRKFIEGILMEPYFADAIEGTFVRIVVGEMDGTPVYRMCEVLSVEDGTRKYQLPDSKQTTILRMTVAIGTKTKPRVKFSDISNRRITADELASYQEAVAESRTGKPLTQNQVKKIKSRRDKIVQGHKYTKEEIESMIVSKSGVSKVGQTTFDIALDNIAVEMQKAREAQDDDALERLGKEKEKIEGKRGFLAEQTTLNSIRQVKINTKNYEKNYLKDMAAGRKMITEERAAKKGGELKLDPFLRRPTRPENVWSIQPDAPPAAAEAAKAALGSDKGGKEGIQLQAKSRSVHSMDREFSVAGDMSINAVRQRVKRVLGGVDPLEAAARSDRDVYLEKACAGLPAAGTAAREALRNGKSLEDWAKAMTQAA